MRIIGEIHPGSPVVVTVQVIVGSRPLGLMGLLKVIHVTMHEGNGSESMLPCMRVK
jgi:hypothetical protein